MNDYENRVEEAAAWVAERSGGIKPKVGLILGSGLDPLATAMKTATELSTADIPHYPPSTVEGHAGRIAFGSLGGLDAVVLRGRVHVYEGYDLADVTLPVRLLARSGIEVLILTNAAGGIRDGLSAGDVMLIRDHLNLQGRSPLFGPNVDAWGPRFPDMTEVYDAELREVATAAAAAAGISLEEGVYASCPGPQYETPAEVMMLRGLGADAVGMSTVPEAIVARHMGVRVLGFSVISNLAAGISPVPLSHQEVVEAGQKTGPRLAALIEDILGRMTP